MKIIDAVIFFAGVTFAFQAAGAIENPASLGLDVVQVPSVENLAPGEQIDPRTRSLIYDIKEVSIPQNGDLPLEVYRSYGKSPQYNYGVPFAMMNWELSVPRMYMNSNLSLAHHCADPSPGILTAIGDPSRALPRSYVSVNLVIPGEPSRIFVRNENNEWVTNDNWKAECINTNGGTSKDVNNGFLVKSPDGRRYQFDQYTVVYSKVYDVPDEFGGYPSWLPVQYFPTYAFDRYGNSISYHYIKDPNNSLLPDRISGSNGVINIEYENANLQWQARNKGYRVSRIYVGNRVWQYRYGAIGDVLTEVILPTGESIKYEYYGDPRTAVGYRDKVQIKSILFDDNSVFDYEFQSIPVDSIRDSKNTSARTYALISRKLTGPTGLSFNETYSWSVQGGILTVQNTRPTETLLYKFARTETYEHGKLKQLSVYSPGGSLLEVSNFEYVNVLKVGQMEFLADYYFEDEHVENIVRLSKKTINRSGDTYVTKFDNFDSFGNPGLKEEDGPDVGYSNPPSGYAAIDSAIRKTTYEWRNDTGSWILGLPKSKCTYMQYVNREYCDTWVYDSQNILQSYSETGSVSKFSHHPNGMVSVIANGLDEKISFENYSYGVPGEKLDDEGNVIKSRQLNIYGEVEREVDGEGRWVSYLYDGRGRQISLIKPGRDAKTTQWQLFTSLENSGNYYKYTYYDIFSKPSWEYEYSPGSSSIDRFRDTKRDFHGRVISQSNWYTYSDPKFIKTTKYDALGRVLEFTNFSQATTNYDYAPGNTELISYPDGSTESLTYLSYGDPDEKYPVKYTKNMTSPQSAGAQKYRYTQIGRDGTGAAVWFSRNGYGLNGIWRRSWVYGALGKVVKISDTSRADIVFEYDGAGRISKRSDGGRSAEYVYDKRGRLIQKKPAGSVANKKSILTQYDRSNNVVEVAHSGITWTYQYYPDNTLKSESININRGLLATPLIYEFLYGRSGQGYVSSITYPSGEVINLQPNALGWPTKIGSYVSSVEYFPSGQWESILYSDGSESRAELNASNRISGIDAYRGADSYMSLRYLYDPLDNISRIDDLLSPMDSIELKYDGVHRLENTMSDGGVVNNYKYDAMDNLYMHSASGGGGSSISISTGTMLPAEYTHSENGEVTAAGSLRASYDDFGRISSAWDVSNILKKWNIEYDGKDRATIVNIPGSGKRYFVRSNDKLLLEIDPGVLGLGGKYTEYYYLGSGLIASKELDGADARALAR